jgi:hypothetical protein
MNCADGGAATDLKGRVLQAAGTIQHIQDPAENARLVRSSCAATGEYDASDGPGRRQGGCGKRSHSPRALHEAERAPQFRPLTAFEALPGY